MKTQKEYSLDYYYKNKDTINLKRRNKYGEKEKNQAKIRLDNFIKKNGGYSYFKKYVRKFNYKKWKENNPESYKNMIDNNRLKRNLKYKIDKLYRDKEKVRCSKYAVVRIHNSRVDGTKMTTKIIKDLYIKYKFTCAKCGKNKYETKLEIDHIKSIKNGGTNDVSNLQILCIHCNRTKSYK